MSVFVVMLMLTVYPNAVFAATDTIGGTGSSNATSPNYVVAFPITISQSGALQTLGINWVGTQSGNVRLALYTAGSGKPASLVAETASTAMSTGTGWQDITVSGSVTSGSYWVAFLFSAEKKYYMNTGGSLSYYTKTYGTFDATWSGSSTQITTFTANMRVTYTAGPPPADFTITSTPPSQNVGAGSTASFTLNLAAGGGFSETVSLIVTSGCPVDDICSVTPDSIDAFPGSSTLSVPTLITTTGTYSVVVTASSTSKTHTVTATVNVGALPGYNFNVRAGATQIVVTLTYSWSGSGAPPSGSIVIAGPGGSPTLYESGAVVYDRTSIAVSGSTRTYSVIHRVTFTITAPTSTQVWTALVSLSGVSTYNVTIEVS